MRWFSSEVHRHEPALRSYLHSSFPAVRDVDDVVQESYLHILRKSAVMPIRSARAFLFTVARNLALDHVRRNRRSPIDAFGDLAALPVADTGERADVAKTVSRDEKVRRLIEAIDGLPPRCREVVVLRKLKLLPQREVAERLGISEKGVEIQLLRGRTKCRSYLRKHGIRSHSLEKP
jgi:RNA polymerase sigma-70 factor (ECF subfamily)